MIRTFKITNPASGVVLGTYEAAAPAVALDMLAIDAGYANFAAACEATGDDFEDDAGLRVTEITETAPAFPSLSYDGFGINGRDEYRTRIATINRESGTINERDALGRLFAAAPDLLAALRALVARCDTTQLADGSSIDTLAAHMAIRMAEGGE